MVPTATHDSTTWTTQTPEWDSTLASMTLLAGHFAEAHGPTPEQSAAKKARRRLADMTQTPDAHGVIRARYFNDAGYDAWGFDRAGNHDPAQVITTTPNPFHHEEHPMEPVTVYSKPSCGGCIATYRSLERKGIAYQVIDVTQDEEALAHVLALGYQQMPVVETPTEHWSGYQPHRITALAALAAA